MTLVGDPRIIFLDEPTTGLDPRSRHTMWDIVRGLVADGVTILLTTQYLDEADELADRIALLDRGRIVAEGTPAELKRRIPGGHVLFQFDDRAALDAGRDAAARRRGTTTRSTCRCRATVESGRCERCSTASTSRSRSRRCRSARPISTTCSSPSRARQHRLAASQDEKERAMTTFPYAVTDSATMLRRNLRHLQRYPSLTPDADRDADRVPAAVRLSCWAARSARGSTVGAGGRADYLAYVVPGILMITIAAAAQGTSISGGDGHDRGHHRPLPHDGDLTRGAVLTGHVVGAMIQTVGVLAVVIAVGGGDRLPPDRRPAAVAGGDRDAGVDRGLR